jgi:hypothetical protein
MWPAIVYGTPHAASFITPASIAYAVAQAERTSSV